MVQRKSFVRNMAPAEKQITAEQLLREAMEISAETMVDSSITKRKINDLDELRDYRVRRRMEYEDKIRRNKYNMCFWTTYAVFEANEEEFDRARSVYERALHIEFENVSVWLRYVEMEMRQGFLNHARNLFERVTQLLPRVDQFWFKYSYMEELIGNYSGAREIYERWMKYRPPANAWLQYVKFEERCGETQRARVIMEKYVYCHTDKEAFLRLTKFEEKYGNVERARKGFEKAIEMLSLDPDEMTGKDLKSYEIFDDLAIDMKQRLVFGGLDEFFYIKFAEFEERHRELERARAIYKNALDLIKTREIDIYKNKDRRQTLRDVNQVGTFIYRTYVQFEKIHGKRDTIEDLVVQKRRVLYEELIHQNSCNYDAYFDLVRLEMQAGNLDATEDVFERAIAEIPPLEEKKYWRRYIYLWTSYAYFEEVVRENVEKAEQIYSTCLNTIPHQSFSFAKIWVLAGELQIRKKNLEKMREIMEKSLVFCGKERCFKAYAEMELKLGNLKECRKSMARLVENHPHSSSAWLTFIELEVSFNEDERVRALFELCINTEEIFVENPEILWKKYIDYETEAGELDNVVDLYERLVEKTHHVRVYLTYANFYASKLAQEYFDDHLERARAVFRSGNERMRLESKAEERAFLLEKWLEFEKRMDSGEELEKIASKQAVKLFRKRPIYDGGDEFETVVDYRFPEDSAVEQNAGLFAAKERWKKMKEEKEKKLEVTVEG